MNFRPPSTAWWRGYLTTAGVVFVVYFFMLRPSGDLYPPFSLPAYFVQSVFLSMTVGGISFGLYGVVSGRHVGPGGMLFLFSLAVLFFFTSVPIVYEHSDFCRMTDMGFYKPTTTLVSLWVYLGGDGGVYTSHGYVWATYGGALPC